LDCSGKIVARSWLPAGFTVLTASYHIAEHAQAFEMANDATGLWNSCRTLLVNFPYLLLV